MKQPNEQTKTQWKLSFEVALAIAGVMPALDPESERDRAIEDMEAGLPDRARNRLWNVVKEFGIDTVGGLDEMAKMGGLHPYSLSLLIVLAEAESRVESDHRVYSAHVLLVKTMRKLRRVHDFFGQVLREGRSVAEFHRELAKWDARLTDPHRAFPNAPAYAELRNFAKQMETCFNTARDLGHAFPTDLLQAEA